MGRAKQERNAKLPPRMTSRRQRSGNVTYYYSMPGVRRIEIPLGGDLEEAMARYHALAVPSVRAAVPLGTARALHKSMVKNAKVRGIPVELCLADIDRLLASAAGKCSITGMQFDSTQYEGHRIRPWMPSIDRINPRDGYHLENVRIVCAAVNVAMNQFGEETFLRICAAVMAKQKLMRSAQKSAERTETAETLAAYGGP